MAMNTPTQVNPSSTDMPETLRIHGNDAYPAKFRRSQPTSAPRARYPGFKQETLLLRAGTIRREGAMPLPCDILFERDVAVTLRDGTVIYTDVFRPPGSEAKVPGIVAWSPYGKQYGGHILDDIPHRCGVPLAVTSGLEKFEGPDPAYWVARGYAVIHPDSRGAYASGGHAVFWGRQLAEDGHDLIEWAAAQAWCSGRLAMSGNSWLAMSQWHIAASRPPHLAAIAPWEGLADPYRDMVVRGGMPNLAFPEALITTCLAGDSYIEDLPRMATEHPLVDEYWEDKIPRLDLVDVPAYVVSSYGNPLHTRGTFTAWRGISSRDKWLRVHNTFEWPDYYDPENVADLQRFFDHYLKGVDNGWISTPRVRISILDPGHEDTVNRAVEDWPVPGYPTKKLHLHADHTISSIPSATSSRLSYECGTEALLTFTHVFTKETELVGPMNLRLHVEAAGSDDMDLLAYAEKRDRQGHAFPLPSVIGEIPSTVSSSGLLRVSHRGLDPNKSIETEPVLAHSDEQPLMPGQVVAVEVGLWPTALRFHPGEQLTLTVRPAPVSPTDVDNGYGVAVVPVPAEGGTYEPGDESVRFLGLGGALDSQPAFVNEQRVGTPRSRNKGTHVFHMGGEYESVLLVPLAEVA